MDKWKRLRQSMKTACEVGDFHKVFASIKDGQNPRSPLPGSQYPLHYAAYHGNLEAVRMLVEVHGCKPQQCVDKFGCTPLHYICYGVPEALAADNKDFFGWTKEPSSGHFEVANFLLNKVVSSGCIHIHRTKSSKRGNAAPLLLHLACKYGTAKFVRFFIEEHNYCLTTINMDEDTVVHVASKYGHVEILKYLLEEKLCSLLQLNKYGNTPLHLACKYQHFEAVQYLVGKQPNLTMEVNQALEQPTHLACIQGSLEIVRLVTTSSNILAKAHNGATLLHVASSHGSLEVVKFLIEELHCEPSTEDDNHLTALDYACGHATHTYGYYIEERVDRRNIQVVEYLVGKCGCDPMKTSGRCSPMQIACNYHAGHLGLVKALTIKNVNCLDSHGNTPLHLACRANQIEIVRFLVLENHCSQEIPNDAGELPLHIACSQLEFQFPYEEDEIPLHIACSEQSLELVKLVSHCDVNVPTKNGGDTPMHIACIRHQVEVIAFLTQERHCDLNIPNTKGELPLHIACENECLEMVKLVSKCDLHVQTKSGFTPLHIACERNCIEIVEYLVQEKHCTPNQYPHLYNSLLIHCACAKGKEELVRKLANPANANMSNQSTKYQYDDGNTPLHEACGSANVEVVKFLVEEFQCVQDVQNRVGKLPLHLACDQGSLEIVKLVSQCDVNCQTEYGATPLHIACREEAVDVVRYLTMSDCDMTLANCRREVALHIACSKQCLEMVKLVSSPLVYTIKDDDGNTPLHIASKYGRVDTVRFLTESYVYDLTIQNSSNELPLHYACQHSLQITQLVSNCDVESRTSHGVTPLHIACQYRKLDIVRYLIEKKSCNPDVEDSKGLTVLDYACGHTRYGFTQNLNRLAAVQVDRTQVQATVVYLMSICDYDPANVLSLFKRACAEDNIELAKSLTTNAADLVNSSDAEGNTPLHIACMNKHFEIVKFLTEDRKCNQKIKNQAGKLPLHIACECDSPFEMVKLVSNCDTNAQTNVGNTPLHIACKHKETSFKVVEFLIEQCQCDQTIQNINGELPLHIACSQNTLEVVKLVSNCDINVQTKHGSTPLHIACEHNKIKIIQFLTEQCECDQTIQNVNGELPVHIVCSSQSPLEVVKLVSNCDINVQAKLGNTPLHIACKHSEIKVVQFLTEQCRCDQTIQNSDGELPLHIACSQKSTEVVKLVSNDCNVNIRTTKGDTALHIVCRYPEQIDIADFLVNRKGADPFVLDGSSRSPIHTACKSDNLALVKILVASTINCTDRYGNTPLHIACTYKCWEIVKFLVEEAPIRTDLSIQNSWGNLALHIACETRLLALVKLVSNCNPDVKNRVGDTPVHIACKQRALSCVKYLVKERNYDISVQNKDGEIPLHIASNTMSISGVKLVSHCTCEVNSRTATGDTPLHMACQQGDVKLVQYLLKTLKCDPNIQNKDGELPLHIACSVKSLKLVKYLSNCDPDLQTVSGDTPLHEACKPNEYCMWSPSHIYNQKCVTIAQYLTTEMKCDCTIQNNRRELPLHFACEQSLKLVQLVSDCDVNSQAEDGNTPLHIACMNKKMGIIKYLTETKQCDKNIQNQKGELPLHIACAHNNLKMAMQVCGCNVNAVTTTGDTPLHVALSSSSYPYYKCNRNLVKFLISKGHCDVTLQNNEGELPLHIACEKHCMEVIRLVEECDVNARTKSGDTPLHIVCRRNHYDPNRLKIVERLVKKMHCNITIQNNNKELPLHIACHSCSLDVVKLVSDCNVAVQTVSGDTPLHCACRNQDYVQEIVTFLTQEKFCDPTIRNRAGQLPLHIACSIHTGSLCLVELLTNCDADSNCITLAGDTPLHEACKADTYWYSSKEVVQFLVERKHCDPNLQNNVGMTPLHYACKLNAKETIKYLLSTGQVGPSIVAKDMDESTPVMLTEDFEIVRELLKHGSDPHPLYQRYQKFFRECSSETPPPTPLKVLVLGNASTGKSTLIESLKAEGQMVVQDSDPNAHTAGIIPNQFKSKEYGLVTFYDFAGQHEYYAGHEAVIQTIVRNTPPVILLLVDVSESEDIIIRKILYWLSFSSNQLSTVTGTPHFIIVGSHADVVTNCGGDPKSKVGSIIESLNKHFDKSTVNFIAFSTMDCRVSESLGINDLRCHLRKCSKVLGDYGVMNFMSHCFHVYLLEHFRDLPAVSLNQITNVLTYNRESSYRYQSEHERSNPRGLLPTMPSEIDSICEELSEKGHIVFLKASRRRSSWVILNKEALFGEVNGTVFAPVGFKQHKVFASSTGVVPFSAIASNFPKHDPNMIVSFLSHLEFCHVITDEEVMSFIGGSRPDCPTSTSASPESYFFFPHLVSIERPQEVWKPVDNFDYQCGWLLWCSEAHHFFTTRFLQVVLLRLAFKFALKYLIWRHRDQPSIQRCCSIWKNGISWPNEDGIQTLVEVRDQSQTVMVMMRCIGGTAAKIECASLRSSIIQKILEAKEEFCSELSMTEYFIDPHKLQYPPGPPQELTLFSLSAVARSVMKAKPCVICDGSSMSHPPLELEAELLHFEPYAGFGDVILKELFNEEKKDTKLTDCFLYDIADMVASKAKCIDHKKDCLLRMFDPPRTMIQERIRQAPEGVTHELVRIFQLWRDRSTVPTYGGLRQKLDAYSVFCGRNPLELASEEQR